jgi:hypothetical protein
MKGKLIKTDVNYILEDDKGVVIASTSLKRVEGLSLSLKNCQAIEGGYNLDELVKREYLDGYDTTELCRTVFKDGFQKALELMGDKKFSEEDVKNIFARTLENAPSTESHTRMISDVEYRHFVMDELYDKVIQSLQQTEWDVEVVMEKVDLSFGCYKIQQKFDSDGCLILKRTI